MSQDFKATGDTMQQSFFQRGIQGTKYFQMTIKFQTYDTWRFLKKVNYVVFVDKS